MAKKNNKICYNCKHSGDRFKVVDRVHMHCEHPNEEVSGDKNSGWDTLREWWNKCDSFEKKEDVQ